MSWQNFIHLPNVKGLPIHEQMRQYNIYNQIVAEEQMAHVMMQTQAGSGASPITQTPLPSNCIEYTINTTNGMEAGIRIQSSATINYTITWGNEETISAELDSNNETLTHTFASGLTHTIRVCFDNASLITQLQFSLFASVNSIIGLTNLTNLTSLDIDGMSLQTLDVSGLSNLTFLDASDCNNLGSTGLKTINLTGCTALQILNLDDNDFSAGFPDLSDCTSLVKIDFDQCRIVGSVDISNLPALNGVDFSQNGEITEIIISRTQPLSDNEYELLFNDCALTQTAVDNILVELANSSILTGYVDLRNNSFGTNSAPGAAGLAALTVLNGKGGWTYDVVS